MSNKTDEMLTRIMEAGTLEELNQIMASGEYLEVDKPDIVALSAGVKGGYLRNDALEARVSLLEKKLLSHLSFPY